MTEDIFLFIPHPSSFIPSSDGGGASRTHTGREARRLSTPLSYQLDDASLKIVSGAATEGRGIEPLWASQARQFSGLLPYQHRRTFQKF
jgi:hypothetical protein